MARVTFIQPTGEQTTVDAPAGESVMRAAVNHGIRGIAADCGGVLSCATCHVYIRDGWAERIPPASADEKVMLESAIGVADSSRLSCQIKVSDALDGLVVGVPASQY
jgi:2Fe-2S ferredoxin